MASENFTDKNAVFRKLKAKSERNRLMPSHAFNFGSVTSRYSVLTSSLVENLKRLSMKEISWKGTLRGNLEAVGVPTSVPVRVAYELLLAGHRYLDDTRGVQGM